MTTNLGNLEPFKRLHLKQPAIVCGCGESANKIKIFEGLITIGLSDIGRLFDPTYLVVCNYGFQYSIERLNHIKKTRSDFVFTTLKYTDLTLKNLVYIKPGAYAGVDIDRNDSLPYTNTSAYIALCLAAYMGADPIGVLGVDFTEDHFYGPTGVHALANELDKIDREFRVLGDAFCSMGITVFNLSSESRITAFRRLDPLQFQRMHSAF